MLFTFDNNIIDGEPIVLAGVDEAGRGPLAGPVYAAVVILDYNNPIQEVNDSKKLTARKRQELYDIIISNALDYSIASVSAAKIDEINILNASMLAMKLAVEGLKIKPDLVLIDGNKAPELYTQTKCIIKGDSLSASIAAASILAKVARDNFLIELSVEYPVYKFNQHKGYPTKLHYEMLDEYGPCEEHRESFLKKWRAKQK